MPSILVWSLEPNSLAVFTTAVDLFSVRLVSTHPTESGSSFGCPA